MATTPVSAEANQQKTSITEWPGKVREYFTELQAEMKRVTWPTRQQVIATTGVVLACVFAFSAYFWAVDIVVGTGVKTLLEKLR